jgi:hypothetical protein
VSYLPKDSKGKSYEKDLNSSLKPLPASSSSASAQPPFSLTSDSQRKDEEDLMDIASDIRNEQTHLLQILQQSASDINDSTAVNVSLEAMDEEENNTPPVQNDHAGFGTTVEEILQQLMQFGGGDGAGAAGGGTGGRAAVAFMDDEEEEAFNEADIPPLPNNNPNPRTMDTITRILGLTRNNPVSTPSSFLTKVIPWNFYGIDPVNPFIDEIYQTEYKEMSILEGYATVSDSVAATKPPLHSSVTGHYPIHSVVGEYIPFQYPDLSHFNIPLSCLQALTSSYLLIDLPSLYIDLYHLVRAIFLDSLDD